MIEWVLRCQTVKQRYYIEVLRMFRERVKNRQDLLSNHTWILHQDNVSMPITLSVKQFLVDKRIIMLENPQYSLDLIPYDLYLFIKVKNALMGTHFQSAGELMVKTACLLKMMALNEPQHSFERGKIPKQLCIDWEGKKTVWSALWADGIIGPYFFKNDEGHNVTVNGDRYRAMIINFFIPELNNHDVQELWFQQDGAICHTARATIDLLKDTFGDRLISRFGPVNWPPRSCDLTPLDYFLWGYVKSLVYAVKPQTPDHLEDNIRRVIADIRPQMLEKFIEN
ncbi:transposable element Tc3 transposase [Trichonephila clavipes]|nr:transposable element Tc3 transposase [Trichonephila clavipes]